MTAALAAAPRPSQAQSADACLKLARAPLDRDDEAALRKQLDAWVEGRLVPRDAATAIKLLRPWSQWDYDTRLKLVHVVADNPTVEFSYPDHYLSAVTADAEVGEAGAMEVLIALKLSKHVQFADRAGGCAPARQAAMTQFQTECGPN